MADEPEFIDMDFDTRFTGEYWFDSMFNLRRKINTIEGFNEYKSMLGYSDQEVEEFKIYPGGEHDFYKECKHRVRLSKSIIDRVNFMAQIVIDGHFLGNIAPYYTVIDYTVNDVTVVKAYLGVALSEKKFDVKIKFLQTINTGMSD